MAIDSLSNSVGLAATQRVGATSSGSLDREAFMQLLVAQLRNQDPLDPMDARDFVTQLSQLSGVEQLVTMSNRIEGMEMAMAGVANVQAASLTGKHVTANTSTLRLPDQGPANGSFSLTGAASTVTVRVLDGDGRLVRTLTLNDQSPGTRTFTWDGKDEAGTRAESGNYRIEVTAQDASGLPVPSTTSINGIIGSISYEGGVPTLVVGGAHVVLGDVITIGE